MFFPSLNGEGQTAKRSGWGSVGQDLRARSLIRTSPPDLASLGHPPRCAGRDYATARITLATVPKISSISRSETISGGVSCNRELRSQLADACAREGFQFKCADPWLCTDNAAMIAFAALLRLRAGFGSKVTEEIDPNLALA